jgi:ABC-type phosphate transport system substrate-binding protein
MKPVFSALVAMCVALFTLSSAAQEVTLTASGSSFVYPFMSIAKDKPLVFSGPVLADIFTGKINQWNDPAVAKLNPGVKLPAADITVVHRSGGLFHLRQGLHDLQHHCQ